MSKARAPMPDGSKAKGWDEDGPPGVNTNGIIVIVPESKSEAGNKEERYGFQTTRGIRKSG